MPDVPPKAPLRTSPPVSPKEWMEDAEEGELADWMEDEPEVPGQDLLAGVLKRVGSLSQAPAGMPLAFLPPESPSDPGAGARRGRAGTARPEEGSEVSPEEASPVLSTVASGIRPKTSPPHLRTVPSTEVDQLRADLAKERQRRLDLETALAEAQRPSAERSSTPSGGPSPAAMLETIKRLRHELEETHQRLEEMQVPHDPAHPGAPMFAVPVGFLGVDGATVLGRAAFSVGKGEAFHRLIGSFLLQWRQFPYPPVAKVTPKGLVISLPRDRQGRSIRILPTGAIQLQMGPKYLDYVRDLPPLVSFRE